MRVTVQGFEWKLGGVPVNDFFEFLTAEKTGLEFKAAKQQRVFYSIEKEGFQCGLLITISDRQTSLELLKEGGKYKVQIRRESGGAAKPMEFNGFILYPKTRRGLYLTYRGSCSLRDFGFVSRALYNQALEHFRDIEIGELDELHDEKGIVKQKNVVRSRYKRGNFKCLPLLRDQKLKELIKHLKRISAFEWTYASAQVKEPTFRPVKNFVTTEKGVLRFSLTTTNPGKIRKAIVDFIAKYGPKRGHVVGINESGKEEKVFLKVKPEVYADYDFDGIVDENFVNLSNLGESVIFKKLFEVLAENKRLIKG